MTIFVTCDVSRKDNYFNHCVFSLSEEINCCINMPTIPQVIVDHPIGFRGDYKIEAAVFSIRANRLIEEHISGSVAASERPGFILLLDRMENGDVLIFSKLNRLGRNAMDSRKTVEQLAVSDIRAHCLALGGVDLTSAAGRMTMQVISAVAGFASLAYTL